MDITIEVMLLPRGTTDWTVSAHPKWRVLAPVCVYYPSKIVPTIGVTMEMPRTGYVHVTGVPEPAAWAGWSDEQIQRRLNLILAKRWNDDTEKRSWCGDPSVLTANLRNTLRTTRQITVTWTQFKNALKNLEEASRALTDADVA